MNIQELELDQIKPAEYNPRIMTADEFGGLVESIKLFGQQENLIVNQDMTLISGHQRLRAMQKLGFKTAMCNLVDLDKHQEKKLNVLMNSQAISGKYDDLLLAEILEEMKLDADYEPLRLNVLEPLDLSNVEVEEDEAPEVSSDPPVSKLGEIYQLGRHRVMCGDSTDKASVQLLMDGAKADMVFTDPPYGINVVGDKGNIGGGTKSAPTTKFRKVIGDDKEFDPTFLLGLAPNHFIWGGNYFSHLLPKGGRWFVWDKNRPEGLSLSDCELAWSDIDGVKVQKFKCTWDGYHKEGESGTRVHPNQKPIKLLADVLDELNVNTILDLFLGSGSTLIACEQTDRTCYGMELDPKYVDVIRKRYAKFIGKEEQWQEATPLAGQQ